MSPKSYLPFAPRLSEQLLLRKHSYLTNVYVKGVFSIPYALTQRLMPWTGLKVKILWHVYEVFSIFWFLQTSARASGRNIEKLLMACHHTWRNYSVWDLKWQKLHIPVDQCDLHFIVLWFGAISWRLFSEFASLLKDKICVRIQITPIILNSKVPDRSVRVTSSTSYANSDIMKGKVVLVVIAINVYSVYPCPVLFYIYQFHCGSYIVFLSKKKKRSCLKLGLGVYNAGDTQNFWHLIPNLPKHYN